MFASFATVDKMYSIREVMSKDARFAMFKQFLSTSTVGLILPAFKEDYGDAKAIDLVGTLSHDFFSATVEGATMSGIHLDKNGNLKLNVNMGAQIIVEKTPGQWVDARNFFVTATVKGKISVNDTDPENKVINFIPRGLELSTFKIYKDEEEMFLEQMLAQSLINV